MLKQWLAGGSRFGILAVFVTFTAFPFYWLLITAFKQTRDLLNPKNNPFVFNMPPTLDHVRVLFTDTMFAQWLLNTALVGVLVVGITLLLAVPAGYSLARLTGEEQKALRGELDQLLYKVSYKVRKFQAFAKGRKARKGA